MTPDRGILSHEWESIGRRRRARGPGGGDGDGCANGEAPLGASAPRGGGGLCGLPGVPRPRAVAGPSRRRGSAWARPGLPQADRAVVGPPANGDSGRAPGTTTCKPSATRSPAEEAVKWERRRLQALEEGWQICRALRARLEQMLAVPPEKRPSPRRAGPGDAGGRPRRRRTARGGQEVGGVRAVAGERPDGDAAGEAGHRAGVGHPERGHAAPREDRPADGDARGARGFLALHPRFGRPPPRDPGHLSLPHLTGWPVRLGPKKGPERGTLGPKKGTGYFTSSL